MAEYDQIVRAVNGKMQPGLKASGQAPAQQGGPLSEELQTYDRLLPTLMSDEGKFAVIARGQLLGVFASYEDALREGYKAQKLEPFLVKKIAATENIYYFTRDVDGSCHIFPSQ